MFKEANYLRNIKWEDERVVMLRKCISMLKERNIPGDMAEVGVYTGEFSKLFNRYFPEKSCICLILLKVSIRTEIQWMTRIRIDLKTLPFNWC